MWSVDLGYFSGRSYLGYTATGQTRAFSFAEEEVEVLWNLLFGETVSFSLVLLHFLLRIWNDFFVQRSWRMDWTPVDWRYETRWLFLYVSPPPCSNSFSFFLPFSYDDRSNLHPSVRYNPNDILLVPPRVLNSNLHRLHHDLQTLFPFSLFPTRDNSHITDSFDNSLLPSRSGTLRTAIVHPYLGCCSWIQGIADQCRKHQIWLLGWICQWVYHLRRRSAWRSRQ